MHYGYRKKRNKKLLPNKECTYSHTTSIAVIQGIYFQYPNGTHMHTTMLMTFKNIYNIAVIIYTIMTMPKNRFVKAIGTI